LSSRFYMLGDEPGDSSALGDVWMPTVACGSSDIIPNISV
jgi:hypothetical protein